MKDIRSEKTYTMCASLTGAFRHFSNWHIDYTVNYHNICNMPEPYIRHPNTFCSVCKIPIYKRPSEISRGNVFCSKKCHGISQRITHPCPVCGIEVLTSKNALTCSRECSNKNRTGIKYNTGRKRDIGFSIRCRREELIKERGGKCEICKFDNISVLEIHHRKRKCDGGTDEKENLILLCANCHLLQHKNLEA